MIDLDNIHVDINPKGMGKKYLDKYAQETVNQQLLDEQRQKIRKDQNHILTNLITLNHNMDILIKQNTAILEQLVKLNKGPKGLVHYMEFNNYKPSTERIFVDFVRGDKDNRSTFPANLQKKMTFPYSEVFMLKITNDGPADIEFQTNRHAMMIKLRKGESEPINENENFPITELYIANISDTANANVRVTIYA